MLHRCGGGKPSRSLRMCKDAHGDTHGGAFGADRCQGKDDIFVTARKRCRLRLSNGKNNTNASHQLPGIFPMYDPLLVQPMRDELTRVGFDELKTPADIDTAMAKPGSTLLVINSVCGCAAGTA
ncbi:MAG: BrxA/BrxB family bacilliredoxin, partial [Candidatus Kapaibacterium sp.]